MMNSVVLLSGGLDSTVSLAQALREGKVQLCLTFAYGQRAATNEIKASSQIAKHYGLAHRVISLDFFADITQTALIDKEAILPTLTDQELDILEVSTQTAAAVWVPNRNGVFLNIAASFAEALGCDQVVTGFNREEALTFPDNSQSFVACANKALSYSTANGVRVVSYTQNLDKEEIVSLGNLLGIPFALLWSCYQSGDSLCGVCESCQRFFRALKKANQEKRNDGF